MEENKKKSYYYDEEETYTPLNLDEVKIFSKTNLNESSINYNSSKNYTCSNGYIYIAFLSAFLILISFVCLIFAKVSLIYLSSDVLRATDFKFIKYFGIFTACADTNRVTPVPLE